MTALVLTALGCCVSAGPPEQLLTLPRLGRGQELVYEGICVERSALAGGWLVRRAGVEARVYVLGTTPRHVEAAFLTTRSPEGSPPDARLGVGRLGVDGTVRLRQKAGDEPPSWELPPAAGDGRGVETGLFIELPDGETDPGRVWRSLQSPRLWRALGADKRDGRDCVKVASAQTSAQWDSPTPSGPAWHRQELAWWDTKSGLVVRLERTVRRREAGSRAVSSESITTLDLRSDVFHSGLPAADREREVGRAVEFEDDLRATSAPGTDPIALLGLQRRIVAHLQGTPPTPYRVAVDACRERLNLLLSATPPRPTYPAQTAGPTLPAPPD